MQSIPYDSILYD